MTTKGSNKIVGAIFQINDRVTKAGSAGELKPSRFSGTIQGHITRRDSAGRPRQYYEVRWDKNGRTSVHAQHVLRSLETI